MGNTKVIRKLSYRTRLFLLNIKIYILKKLNLINIDDLEELYLERGMLYCKIHGII